MIVQPWTGFFPIFLQYIQRLENPKCLAKPGFEKRFAKSLMMGSNNLINQNMSRPGWPFTRSGRKKTIKCLVTIGCIQSFLCAKLGVYIQNARHKIVVFASRTAFAMQQLCLSEPDPSLRRVSSFDMFFHDKTSKPQGLPMTWDDHPFYF